MSRNVESFYPFVEVRGYVFSWIRELLDYLRLISLAWIRSCSKSENQVSITILHFFSVHSHTQRIEGRRRALGRSRSYKIV